MIRAQSQRRAPLRARGMTAPPIMETPRPTRYEGGKLGENHIFERRECTFSQKRQENNDLFPIIVSMCV